MPKTIAIVGGGIAGIASAKVLLGSEKDVKIVLFESSGRIGGRAWTKNIDGFNFDMGAQFIQDPYVNPWFKIAKNLGAKLFWDKGTQESLMKAYPQVDTYSKIVEFLKQIPTFDNPSDKGDLNLYLCLPDSRTWVLEGEKWVLYSFQESIREKLNPWKEKIEELSEGASNLFNQCVFSLDLYNPEGKLNMYQLLAINESGFQPFLESAEPWQYLASDQSRQETLREKNCPDMIFMPNLLVCEGVGTMVEHYAKTIKGWETIDLRLNCEVMKIESGESKVSITSSSSCDDFDGCIVTIPVGRDFNKIDFGTSFDERIEDPKKYLKLGSYKKMAFRIHSENPIENLEESTEYFIPDVDNQGVWQYYRYPFYPEGVWVAVCSGDMAKDMDKNDKVSWTSFEKMFCSVYNIQESSLKLLGCTNWFEVSGGAYSYTAPSDRGYDDKSSYKSRKVLNNVDGKLLFAGEALFMEQYGTIEGAYKSAEEQSIRLLKNLFG